MKIGFIIPLKSKRVSEDWQLTSNLLKQTLYSLNNQSCLDFVVVVVGHEKPSIENFESKQILFKESPFNLLIKNERQEINSYLDIDRILDKLQKTHIGLQVLSAYDPDYYMVLDADDILHKDFVKHIITCNDPNGYVAKEGYLYYSLQNKLIKSSSLDKVCGSTTIIHKQHLIIPPLVDEKSFYPILWCHVSHENMEQHFADKKIPLQPIPFQSVLYSLNHGQNDSNVFRSGFKQYLKQQIKIHLLGKRVTNKIKKDFSLV